MTTAIVEPCLRVPNRQSRDHLQAHDDQDSDSSCFASATDAETIRQAMVSLARDRYRLPAENDQCRHIKRVVVLLSSSRSGSSTLAAVLGQNPELSSLDGEVEPYWALTGNCYPHFGSDALRAEQIRNAAEFRRYLQDELSTSDYGERWRKRLLLQFPERVFSTGMLRTPADVPEFLARHDVAGYYDGQSTRTPYRRVWKIEEPPFVLAQPARPRTATLLLKSPSDSYRIGVYETIFPHAQIVYLHLTRNAASAVNGLIDGWAAQYGFFSHCVDGRPWKFDLPPGFEDVVDAPVSERCLFQWQSAHRHILDSGKPSLRIQFEEYLRDPQETVARVCRFLDLEPHDFVSRPVMATQPPRPYRWRDRASVIGPLMRRRRVRELMRELDYGIDEELWL